MANVIERVYNIPLRKEFQKTAKYRRAKKAIIAVKEFLKKNMKSEDVKLGKNLNFKIWERGIKSPPHHVKVNVTKDDKGEVRAELVGFTYDEPKLEKKAAAVKKAKAPAKKEDKQEAKTAESSKLEEKAEANEEVKEETPKAEAPKKQGRKSLKKKLDSEKAA